MPEANEKQAAIAARDCGITNWEWTSGIYSFDSELKYPSHMGIAFSFDLTEMSEAEASKMSDRVDRTSACLEASLAKQGVGANIAGSTQQMIQATDEPTNAQTH
ncbi:MAG: hypothetical protein V4579_13150 [Pseudomonadota bacterium]